jgi:histidinol-phosphate aminotransferase
MIEFIRPAVRAMSGYTPGEQPQQGRVIKLNTNENPYPPSPRVVEAIKSVLAFDRLRKYPDPTGRAFREAAARVLGVEPANILIGNGSDDVLTVITRAIVPEGGLIAAASPSYLLYHTLGQIQNARCVDLPFTSDWRLEPGKVQKGTHLTYLPNPNSPSGTLIPPDTLADWPTPLVLDEAYTDFAPANGLQLWRQNPRILITRSLSKSYALAGIRFGFAVGDAAVIAELYKVKDSYNCDALSLAAAAAALDDQPYMLAQREKILATRARLERALVDLGFDVTPSQANFVWCRKPIRSLEAMYLALKTRNIFIRHLAYPHYGEGLRISVGTDEEIDRLLEELRKLV